MDFILTIVRALRMAKDLPFFVALPVYVIAYGAAAWIVLKVIELGKAIFF